MDISKTKLDWLEDFVRGFENVPPLQSLKRQGFSGFVRINFKRGGPRQANKYETFISSVRINEDEPIYNIGDENGRE